MKELKTKQELEDIIGLSEKIIFVKVGAFWCGPCKTIERTILDIEGGYTSDYDFYEINVDEADDNLVSRLAVYNLPTIVIFKRGEEVYRHSGLLNRDQLTGILDKFKQ